MRKLSLISIIIISGLLFSACNPLELKQKAGLQVTTNNSTASLFLDDQYLEKTPFIDKKIQPKSYVLRIQPDDPGLVPYELPIELNKGLVTVITWKPGPTLETSGGVIYEMEKLNNKNATQLEFNTVPDGAILAIDGGSKQFSPLLMTNLKEGNHQFEVSLPSYETQQHSVNLIKGHQVTVTVILSKTGELPNTKAEEGKEKEETSKELNTELINEPVVEILSTNFFVDEQEVLRVRSEASPAGQELGFAPVGETYPYQNEEEDWFQISFEGQSGWVSAQFSRKITSASAQITE
jgi:hypothetical protein